MNAALYDEAGGYYKRSDLKRWGREGDYRTSPERSELFAATFARYFVKLYHELQQPAEWTIVEAGPGAGDFATFVQRELRDQYTDYFLIESSAELAALPPIRAGIFFSNEVLDAFPVHRLIKTGDELFELYVALDAADRFVWSNGPLSTPALNEFLREYSVELEDGQIIEVNLQIDDWLSAVAAKLERGFLISVDYGAEGCDLYDVSLRPQGTLRAFSRHAFVDDVLAQPGDCDITASINWSQVQAAGARLGFTTVEFAPQDRFLMRAGLLDELQRAMNRTTSDADKLSLSAGAREMILPGGMASSFQVLVQKRGF
ncbi:MAG TPA: SAM-dependent methyltransferase [Pyrinomonadaceae bacterium]|jgi:SAM-dependent MidA family methyltransferase|nr:SAM-dependent methyltransferase [Pyrinomonadaceae bacterium]